MKKQIKKLSLSKKTISNLEAGQLKNLVGGNATNGAFCNTGKCTQRCYPTHGNCLTYTCRTHCGC